MFKIGDFSKLCRVPVSALRYYADIGLLQPARIDASSGYRYYTLGQLPRLHRILALKDLGLSLEQINQLLRDELTGQEIRGILRLKEAELEAELADRTARLARVRARLDLIDHEDDPMPELEVVLKQIEVQPVLSLREIAPLPESVGHLFEEIYPVLMSNQIEVATPPLTVFHDEEFKLQNLDVEVAFPVAADQDLRLGLQNNRALVTHELPYVDQAACIYHRGDFDTLEVTYAAIGKWVEANQYNMVGPIREIYIQPPGLAEESLIEIQFPVEKQS